jgi:ferritin
MQFAPDVAAQLIAQVTRERYAEAFYTQLATWADTAGYDGFAAFFDAAAAEERTHAQRVIMHIRQRDGFALQPLDAPFARFDDIAACVVAAYELEQTVSAALTTLHETAESASDGATCLLAMEMLREQAASEKELYTMIQIVSTLDASGLRLYDHELRETVSA